MHIYISGPYTQRAEGEPTPEENQQQAIRAAELMREGGHHCFLPHTLYPAWVDAFGLSYEEVMDECLAWVGKCDAVLRIGGRSPGADAEEQLAREMGMTVYRLSGAQLEEAQPEEWR